MIRSATHTVTVHRDEVTPIRARCRNRPGRRATRFDPAEPGVIEIEEVEIGGFPAGIALLTDREVRAIEEGFGEEARR